jgi:hypothetical protein
MAVWDFRIDRLAVDPAGEPALVSLALAPTGNRVLFDDSAVSWALRQVLAQPAGAVISTLTLDSATIGGAFTATFDVSPRALADDPFGWLMPARVLRVRRASSAGWRRRSVPASSGTRAARGPGIGSDCNVRPVPGTVLASTI